MPGDGAKAPAASLLLQFTVPVGVVFVPLSVSVTVAVQLAATPTARAPQLTVVEVVRLVTVVVAVAELLVELGSEVAELLTVAVLEMVVPSAVAGMTWTTRVKVAVAPLARGDVVQLTVPVVPTAGVVQDQPAGAATDWKVVCDGNGSLMVTLTAAFGPALPTLMV